jgi:DNA-binding MarR family transcriptional regulator
VPEVDDADKGKAFKSSLGNLDKLLEHRVRLAVSILLSRYNRLSFSRIKELTGETDGNLGANLRRLEDASHISARKEFVDRKPVTWYVLTAGGRRALQAHLDALDGLLRGSRPNS